MACPICQQRKAKRYCPAQAENICSVCCGTEREVTIDCPSDCPHLVASRAYEFERKEFDGSTLPFADVKIPPSFAREHLPLLNAIAYAVCDFARAHREAVDSDAIAAFQALAEAYQTLSKGIYYEKPPDARTERELYEALKGGLDAFRKKQAQQTGVVSLRDGEIRDALIFFTRIGAQRTNGRPKGRAYLDLLRQQFGKEFAKPASSLLWTP